jgi:hypothetical protein
MLLTASSWWFLGLAIGFTIVVVVVVVAASILALAARIGAQAREGIVLMDRARETTRPVWDVQTTNVSLSAIWRAAAAARESLQGTIVREKR